MRYLKTLLISAVCLSFFSSAAQNANTHRSQGQFGIGLNTTLGFSTSKAKPQINSAKTNTALVGGIVTGSYNITESIFTTLGLGYRSAKTVWSSEQNGVKNSNEVKDIGLVYQAGVFKAFNIGSPQGRPVDIDMGLLAIFTDGNKESTNNFGNQSVKTSDPRNSFVIGPVIRPEWFVSDYFSIHAQVGVGFSFINEESGAFSEGGVNIHFVNTGDLFGQTGFYFYF